MLKRITELLDKCDSATSVFPPTELYNEGWMLRLILDWYDRNRGLPHLLSFYSEARWYSEALLPSVFLPKVRGDNRAESFTHADGVIGHFTIAPGVRGEAKLTTDASQFIVVEAKLGSSLSTGTKNAPTYDQAARNVACMAFMIGQLPNWLDKLKSLAFYVIAPQRQIDGGVFGDLVTKESILKKVQARVDQYKDKDNLDLWFKEIFQPVLEHIKVGILSWESILDYLPVDSETLEIQEFYTRCMQFNPQRGKNQS